MMWKFVGQALSLPHKNSASYRQLIAKQWLTKDK